MSLRARVKTKIADPIVEQLTQGLSPEKIALTVAVGLTIAVNPVVGTTTVLCFFAAWALRLNQPIIQAVNWSSYALQLLLIFPFIRLGERIFAAAPETRSLQELVAMAKADALGTIRTLGATIGHAVVGLGPRRAAAHGRDLLRDPAFLSRPRAPRRRKPEPGRRRSGLSIVGGRRQPQEYPSSSGSALTARARARGAV